VPDAADEAPPANRTVTFALDLPNSLVAAAPVAPMQGTRSRTAGTSSRQGTRSRAAGPAPSRASSSRQGTLSASTTGTSSLRRGGRERKKNKRYTYE
jgi:hypothetical protein